MDANGVGGSVIGRLTAHAGCLVSLAIAAFACWYGARRQRTLSLAARSERRMREELEAYAELDAGMTPELRRGLDAATATRELARRICRTVAERSAFTRVTLMMRDPEGRLRGLGSVGVDDLTLEALHRWGESVTRDETERSAAGRGPADARARRSFAISLGEWSSFDREVGDWGASGRRERRRWRRAIVAPIRSETGRLEGAITVCADGLREPLSARGRRAGTIPAGSPERAMSAIELLAARIAAQRGHEALATRLLRAEKLAGLGQLAGGVAHALNNPLTAVIGFAELIAATSVDARVLEDAETILVEASKMRETIARLHEFWQPVSVPDAPVELRSLLEELEAGCAGTLRTRGVRLIVSTAENVPPVRGSRERLRQVAEHLLNNAAQAIASARPREEGEEHEIRITLTADAQVTHLIVSDTGPGFREPNRVFDLFYTGHDPGGGAGLGLSLCYGIVREHGGEITALNLHPHGAAIVVELPVRAAVQPLAEPEGTFHSDLRSAA